MDIQDCLELADEGKDSLAIECFKKYLDHNKANKAALFNLGYLYIKSGQYEPAIERYNSLIVIDPFFLYAIYNLFVAYIKNENSFKAFELLDTTTEIWQNDSLHKKDTAKYNELKLFYEGDKSD